MNVLLDPNVAYLLLVAGVMLGLLALISPGTGLIEIGALFCLVLAGYGMFNLNTNLWALILLVLSVIPFFLALRGRRQKLYLTLSILGVIGGSVFLFRNAAGWPAVNPFLASLVSLLAGGFLWLAADKSLEAHHVRPRHDLDYLAGLTGETKTAVHEDGSVQVAGELWSARSQAPIPAGARVRVVGREGFVLRVEQLAETPE
jgi:membrane-bound ClpP family serine protease